jgi:hypothetical protein
MTMRFPRAPRVRAALSVVLVLGAVSGAGAQQAITDPWTLLPPLPTGCFVGEGDYFDKTGAIMQQMKDEIAAQKEKNEKILEKFRAMDAGEQMRRMQEFMMKNPQEAMKIMQAQADAATDVNTMLAEVQAVTKPLLDERDALRKRFTAEAEAVVKPVQARRQVLVDTRTNPSHEGHDWKTPADERAYRAMIDEENAKYEAMCRPFVAEDGPFHKWMARYKEEVVDKQAAVEKSHETTISSAFVPMGLMTEGYRNMDQFKAVVEYLRMVGETWTFLRHRVTR